MDDRQRSLLLLSLLKGIGPGALGTIISQYQHPQQALEASPEELSEFCNFSTHQIESILHASDTVDIVAQCESIRRAGARLLCLGDDDYPTLLECLPNPPAVLYCRGQQPFPEGPMLSIVGSRQCTTYSTQQIELLLGEMTKRIPQLIVVSGLALGVDSIAHECALKLGLRTVAVLGCGVDVIYPPQHRSLTNRIYSQGIVISEQPMGTPAHAYNFPHRNRIISGLGGALAVTEAGLKSGALITAGFSQNYNRQVFCLPGDVNRPCSQGTNYLLKSGQARMLLDTEEITAAVLSYAPDSYNLAEIPATSSTADSSTNEIPQIITDFPAFVHQNTPEPTTSSDSSTAANDKSLSKEQTCVMNFLARQSMHPDDICRSAEIPMERLLGILLELELSGRIYCDENSLYRRA